jgi:hypothetical protein
VQCNRKSRNTICPYVREDDAETTECPMETDKLNRKVLNLNYGAVAGSHIRA